MTGVFLVGIILCLILFKVIYNFRLCCALICHAYQCGNYASIHFRMMDMFRIRKENRTNNHINHFIFELSVTAAQLHTTAIKVTKIQ